MTERERFYQERDRRTRECGVTAVFEVPVGVCVGGSAAKTRNGQLAVLALVNMLARLHRCLVLQIPPTPLLVPTLVPAARLDDAASLLARAIDPFIRLGYAGHPSCLIGIGHDAPGGPGWYAGAEGQVALIDDKPLPVPLGEGISLGAALAACLSAAHLLRRAQQRRVRRIRLSAWNFLENGAAERGPDLCGPLDVGDVLQVGAGGVGNCLAYWLREVGVDGDWRVVDRDSAALHNTNRCMGLFPADAGWTGRTARNKAEAAASLFGARPLQVWYHELDPDSFRPDLILPLANEHAVRHVIASRGEPIILHATTSRLGEAQLHRHIPGRDDCIVCRMPGPENAARFSCSGAPAVLPSDSSGDAALPFLSAAASVALLSGLFRLQYGDIAHGPHNLWAACFGDERRHGRRAIHSCDDGCATTLAAGARRRIHAGRRWSPLDAAP